MRRDGGGRADSDERESRVPARLALWPAVDAEALDGVAPPRPAAGFRRRLTGGRRLLFGPFAGDLVQLLLQRVQLPFQLGHAVLPRAVFRRRWWTVAGARLVVSRAGREHLHRLFEHGEILLAHLLELADGKHAAERFLHIVLHLLLVAREGLHRMLQVARQQHPLHAVAVEADERSEEHTSELQSLMRISYAVFCLNNKKNNKKRQ